MPEIQKPKVLGNQPSNSGVMTYYFAGFGDTGNPSTLNGAQGLESGVLRLGFLCLMVLLEFMVPIWEFPQTTGT